jgi:hypothetical protein
VDSSRNATASWANTDVEWDSFDSEDYFQDNYGTLLREDAEIIRIVADHFQRWAPRRWRANAIDVGSGTNLYPALTMLPFAGRITLCERAHSNREWLGRQLEDPADSWQQFWAAIRGRPDYDRVTKPFDQLSSRAEVVKGNLFNLPPDRYDMGTMFFVAESITTRLAEFERGLRQFVASLTPTAPFAAAFMRNSSGYEVGGRHFPACSIDENDVARCLRDVAAIDDITVVDSHLHEGYAGMIVVTGRAQPGPATQELSTTQG